MTATGIRAAGNLVLLQSVAVKAVLKALCNGGRIVVVGGWWALERC